MKLFKSLFFVLLGLMSITSVDISASNFDMSYSQVKAEEAQPIKDDDKQGYWAEVINLNYEKGDCSLIYMDGKYIMIDCGGNNTTSANIIYDKIKDIDRLDYLIFTHADEDHIVNFANENGIKKWIGERASDGGQKKIGTLIDFCHDSKMFINTTSVYYKYVAYRTLLKSTGLLENYYSAYECVNKKNGGQPYFQIGKKKGNGLRILNNYFYEHNGEFDENEIFDSSFKASKACNKNLLSVSCLITYNETKSLFTGDIEEFDSGSNPDGVDEFGNKSYKRVFGETLLAADNYQYLKDGVDFYKAAHHGSNTSNTMALMDIIRPRYIAISGGASNRSMHFPGQNALNNMAKWTDHIYITCTFENDFSSNCVPYYGDVTASYDPRLKDLVCTTSEIENGHMSDNGLLDTTYLDNRYSPINIYNLGELDEIGNGVTFTFDKRVKVDHNKSASDNITTLYNAYKKQAKAKGSNDTTNCTYIKFGHIDILINCGGRRTNSSFAYNTIKKIDKLCNDHVLDYLIVSNYSYESMRGLLGNKSLFKQSDIKEVLNFYHFGNEPFKFDKAMAKEFNELLKCKPMSNANFITSDKFNGKEVEILDDKKSDFNLKIKFFDLPYTNKTLNKGSLVDASEFLNYSLMFNLIIEFGTNSYTYTNLGYQKSVEDLVNVANSYKNELKHVDALELLNHLQFNMIEGSFTNDESSDAGEAEKGGLPQLKQTLQKMANPIILVNGTHDEKFELYTQDNKMMKDYLTHQLNTTTILSNTLFDPKASGYKNSPSYKNINTRILLGKHFKTAVFASDWANYFSLRSGDYLKRPE